MTRFTHALTIGALALLLLLTLCFVALTERAVALARWSVRDRVGSLYANRLLRLSQRLDEASAKLVAALDICFKERAL